MHCKSDGRKHGKKIYKNTQTAHNLQPFNNAMMCLSIVDVRYPCRSKRNSLSFGDDDV